MFLWMRADALNGAQFKCAWKHFSQFLLFHTQWLENYFLNSKLLLSLWHCTRQNWGLSTIGFGRESKLAASHRKKWCTVDKQLKIAVHLIPFGFQLTANSVTVSRGTYTPHFPRLHSCQLLWSWCFPNAVSLPLSAAPMPAPLQRSQSHSLHAGKKKKNWISQRICSTTHAIKVLFKFWC